MAAFEKVYVQNLNYPLKIQYSPDVAFTKDNLSNTISVLLYIGEVPYSGGGTASASVVRADGVTVPLSGTVAANKISVSLTDSALNVPGTTQIYIKLTAGSVVTTVFAGVFSVVCSETDSIIEPDTPVSIATLIATINAAIASVPADYSALINSIASNFNPQKTGGYGIGEYVWYSGVLYRFKEPHTGTWQASHVDQVILANDLTAVASVASAGVRYDIGQGLSDAQKATARANINAQEALTIDAAPTEGSTNPVQSGGVYSEVSALKSAIGEVPTGKTVESQITEIQSAIGTVPLGRTVQGQITDHGTRITTLEGDMTDAKRDINALDGEFMDLSVGLSILAPDATAEDVGKALIAKTVNGNKVIEYEFGETSEIDDTAGEGDTNKTWSADKISKIGTGLSETAIVALLACFRHVLWSVENGQTYYNDLYNALHEVQPDPEVPNDYRRYDWIRLKRWSEVPYGTYINTTDPEDGDIQNISVYPSTLIRTSPYSDLNQLNIKTKIRIIPSSKLSNTRNTCIFGGGTVGGATNRLGIYPNINKNWVYVMMHGVERQIMHTFDDFLVIEIINNTASPSIVKLNGDSYSFEWDNSNINNAPLWLFNAGYLSDTSNERYASPFSKVGEIEISNQNSEPVSKLIPVVRKSDNVIGVFDSVRREFYTASSLNYATMGGSNCVYEVGNWNS